MTGETTITDDDLNTPMRMAAFEHVRRLGGVHARSPVWEMLPNRTRTGNGWNPS